MGALPTPLYRKLERLSSLFSLNLPPSSNSPNGMALALKHATCQTAGDEDDRTSLRRGIHLAGPQQFRVTSFFKVRSTI